MKLEGDEKVGADIIKRAMEEPARQIAGNAGHEGSVVVNRLKGEKTNVGFDAEKEEYTDMIAGGIIDPTKVTRSAIQNAASIAALMITTEVLITEKPEEEETPPMPPGGPGGYGGGMY